MSWDDTILSSIPDERVAGESEIEISPSASVLNDISASGASSEGGISARLEPYVRVTRFFAGTMGDDEGGGEEVGGAVLGELFRGVIEMCRLKCPFDALERSGRGYGYLPIVDGHTRMSQGRDKTHVIAFTLALNCPYWFAPGSPKHCSRDTLHGPPPVIWTLNPRGMIAWTR